jgi:large subunit ribosomal protein L6
MSRIGRQQIIIPEKTEVTISDGVVNVKGPLGQLTRNFKPEISVKVEDNKVVLLPLKDDDNTKALWGTYASHILNMVSGVNKVFEKKLIVEGVGFRAEVLGGNLVLVVGFSHPVKIMIPKDLKISVEKNIISISGPDKEAVGQFAAQIRAAKKPEPYKGKGIRYEDEVIRRKQGKRAVT